MVSLIIHAGYEHIDHCRKKNLTRIFSVMSLPSNPGELLKKVFYFLNSSVLALF